MKTILLFILLIFLNSDAVVYGSPSVYPEVEEYIKKLNKKVLPYHPLENIEDAIIDFYINQVLN